MTDTGELQEGDLFAIRTGAYPSGCVFLARLTEGEAIAEQNPVFKCMGTGANGPRYAPWNPAARAYLGMEKKP